MNTCLLLADTLVWIPEVQPVPDTGSTVLMLLAGVVCLFIAREILHEDY